MRAATFAAVLGALLVGHNVGDHLAQTDHQAAHKAAHKAASWPAMAGHVGSYHAVELGRCVEQVLRTAVETGYMLGPDGRVARKLGDSAVTPVLAAEAAAVRQLIASRHLTTGGHHAVELGGRTVSALAVLVPRATRDVVSRWCSYKPLGGSTERG